MENKELRIKKITAWNAKDQLAQSRLSQVLLDAEWDFTQFDGEKDNERRLFNIWEYAEALKKTLDAADALGNIEHTNDWDPFLIITLRNGEVVNSESHYYQINQITERALYVGAPSRVDYKNWEEQPPEKYYVDPEVHSEDPESWPALVIPLAAISKIIIEPQ